MSTQTRNRAIILAMVVVAIVIGLIWPFALDNTKRMKDAEKAVEQGTEMPADR
ncbi:hypothetical protein [Geminicoccus harenae]|uniref:hypothetical protein n=1 Tax=Geminicoccus harenae TaxID=2498453 RepID=UPI00168AC196|nr:hypothetical protein [Geminicoccus harenae]